MNGGKYSMCYSFFSDMNELLDENVVLRNSITNLEIENAMHKALFYSKHALAEKLSRAHDNNLKARIGEFDGFCYDSSRRGLTQKSIEEMYMSGELSRDEYDFCKPMF